MIAMKNHVFILFLSILPILSFSQTVTYDFEDGNLVGWYQSPEARWDISSTNSISGLASLQHSFCPAPENGKDRISVELPSWDASQGSITWRFLVRHNHSPSSLNNWAVFLSSDVNAEGMTPDASPNGYAIGVNLSGSDDLLKLYKLTDGAVNDILTTSINWENDIGSNLTDIGAVEVERAQDGTFTIRVSTDGTFNTLAPQGSVTDIDHGYGNYFGIYFRYTTSYACSLFVDDISLAYKPVNTNDHDVQVTEPSQQAEGGVISSLATSSAQAVDVISFTVEDQGTADGLPVYPTKLRFAKVDAANAANWQQSIQGVRLHSSSGEVPIETTYILPNAIELELNKDDMVVNNSSSKEFTLSLYLNPDDIQDGSTIQLQVDDANHGWDSHHDGSAFAETFPASVTSNQFTIQVIPTHLSFHSYPSQIVVNQPFDVVAHATDVEGNLATSYQSSEVYLAVNQGDGQLTPAESLTAGAVDGVVTWAGISYTQRDPFSLTASASDLEDANSSTIEVINDPTSIVGEPDTQPEGAAISSSITTPGQAVEVFRFKIVDDGANDEVPTIVRRIFIQRPSGANASFSRNLGGVVLKVNGEVVSTGSPHILTSTISIPMPAGAIIVPDGEEVEVSLHAYLKGSLDDGQNLGFMVDTNEHDFIADEDGSTFSDEFPGQVVSNLFPIDVQATRLEFSSTPQHVGLDVPFSVGVKAVDQGGSHDVDAEGTITLSKKSGEGWLEIPTSIVEMSGGEAEWNDLRYYMAEPFTLLASSPDYNDVISPLIYCSDKSSTLLLPEESIPDGEISSLATQLGETVEVFSFRISDPGTTDGLPTYVTQLSFSSFGLPTDFSLSRALDGAMLWVDNEEVLPDEIEITSTTITLNFAVGNFEVPDGETIPLRLGVYLKEGGQIDGSTIRLQVPASDHGWTAASIGSAFVSEFETGLVGPTFYIDVEADSLYFVEQPFMAEHPNPLELSVAATDVYGSIDNDATGDITLGLDYGAGTMQTANNTMSTSNGLATWDDVVLESKGKYRFIATANFYNEVEGYSQPVWYGESFTCAVNENFDDGYPEHPFPNTSHWEVSTVSPVEGAQSLKHALTGITGQSRLTVPTSFSNLGQGPMEWSFVLRNGSWSPSSSNAFWFVLASDTSALELGEFNGYAVGVNLSGSNNLLTLWRVSKGGATSKIIESNFAWEENETVAIRVTRTPNSEWSLWFQPEFGESTYSLAGKKNDVIHTDASYSGLVFHYTSTRAGELWLDNLSICSVVYPPVIQRATMGNLTRIDIDFSAEVNQDDAQQSANYSLRTLEGENLSIIDVYSDALNPKKVALRTEVMPLVPMMLQVEGVRSASGETTVSDSAEVGIGSPGTFGNVIINEIMARPSASFGLPDVEYIELYNRTSKSISLKDWKIRGDDSYATIPDIAIEPDGYIILCGTSGEDAMSEYGIAVGVSSFPTLLVGGMFLAIYDDSNNIMSWVEYSDTWYGDDDKKAGGYSLEKVDPNNLVEGAGNWTGSYDESGGTPGAENSANSDNPDSSSPKVVEVNVISQTEVLIGFSEPMDSLSVTLVTNYEVSSGIGSPLWASSTGPEHSRVTLTFSSALEVGEIYEICFSEAITDFSGNTLETDCLPLALPQLPQEQNIIINEVLFNAYTGGVEFVELFNRSDKAFDLSKLVIANRHRTTLDIDEQYAASDTAWLLMPNSYAVLTENPGLVDQFYHVDNPNAMVWTRKMPSYANSDGYVVVINEQGVIVDEFVYNEKMHNKLISDVKGVSLERINPEMSTSNPASWQSAAQAAGFATPTAKNSQFTNPVESEDEFTLSHKVFSPDGDGFEDVLIINYKLPESGYVANIMVFDSKGRRINRLASNMTLGTSGNITWDGATDGGRRATMGAYVIFIEVFDLNGNIKRYKKTVVVATKLNG